MKNNRKEDIDLKNINLSNQKKHIIDKKAEEKQLKLKLLQAPEDKIQNKFSEKNLDRHNEIQLLNGRTVNLDEEQKAWESMLADSLKEYTPRVPQEYYRQIFRLNNWLIPEGKIKEKPPIVGRYTNEIIYARYNKSVLPELRKRNPYIFRGKRGFKHFQWLTEEGQALFDTFVQDAITVMKDSREWYDFRVKHATKFELTFQLNLEEEQDKKNNI